MPKMSFAIIEMTSSYLSLLCRTVTVEGKVDSAIVVVLVRERDAGTKRDLL